MARVIVSDQDGNSILEQVVPMALENVVRFGGYFFSGSGTFISDDVLKVTLWKETILKFAQNNGTEDKPGHSFAGMLTVDKGERKIWERDGWRVVGEYET